MKKRIKEFKKIEKIVVDVLKEIHLDFDINHIKRVLNQKDDLRYEIAQVLNDLAIVGQYRNESTDTHSLHQGLPISKIMSISDQMLRLRELFPELIITMSPDNIYKRPNTRGNSFVVLKSGALAPTYHKAIEVLLEKMSKVFVDRFKITCKDFKSDYLRQTDQTQNALFELEQDHGDENTIFLYASLYEGSGTSIRNVLEREMSRSFGLDTFSTGIILLTHSELLRYEHLNINCAGDVYYGDCPKQLSFNLVPSNIVELEGTQLYSYRDSDRVSALGFLPREFKK